MNNRSILPLYVAGFLAGIVGMSALVSVLGVTGFTILATALMSMGFCVSWLIVTERMAGWVRNVLFGMLILGTIIAMLTLPVAQQFVFNPTSVESNDPSVAGLLAWMVVIMSFLLVSPRIVLFMCVPLLSMIGLLGTLSGSGEIEVFFVILLGLISFILIQERILLSSGQSETSAPSRTHTSRRVGLAVGITVVTLSIGSLIGSILHSGIDAYSISGLAIYRMAALIQQLQVREYPQVASGPAPNNDIEILTVKSDDPQLLRGETYDLYTGTGWKHSTGHSETRLSSVKSSGGPRSEQAYQTFIPDDPLEGPRLRTKDVHQELAVVAGRYQLVYAAAEPKVIVCNWKRTFMQSDGEIQSRIVYSSETTFRITSEISNATPKDLRSASARYPSTIKSRYLDIPDSCLPAKALAEKITKGMSNPYDKAEAIRQYLVTHFQYDLNAAATPLGKDPVPYFLFESKKGYCDVFASSMVVMCREVGVPTRWVTGFAPGEYNPRDGKYHIQVKDYHAWAEVYFPRYGWVQFDATPGGGGESTRDRMLAAWKRLRVVLEAYWQNILVVSIILLLVAYLLKTELLDRYLSKRRKRQMPVRPGPATDNYRAMCRLLSRAGFPRELNVTPAEYALDLDTKFSEQLSHLTGAVRILTSDFEEARYSDRQVPPERAARGTTELSGLRVGLREAKKRHLLPTGNKN